MACQQIQMGAAACIKGEGRILFSLGQSGKGGCFSRSVSRGREDAFLARSVLGLLRNPAESTRKASFLPCMASCGRSEYVDFAENMFPKTL